jgi:hypothetical protein
VQKYEPQAAAAVVGLAAFELWKVWGNTAPTLADVRTVAPGDDTVRQHLMDADITVGSLAIIIGVTLAILMKDATALIIMMIIFGSLSFFHHWVLAAEPR